MKAGSIRHQLVDDCSSFVDQDLGCNMGFLQKNLESLANAPETGKDLLDQMNELFQTYQLSVGNNMIPNLSEDSQSQNEHEQ